MDKVRKKIIHIFKKEPILLIALIFMLITCFFVPIDKEYLNYFDCKTIVCLFCMLVVVAGLQSTNIFTFISRSMIKLFHTRRGVITALIFGTFFFDMLVANDMSLITFLPFTYIVLHTTNNDKYLAFTFILQTIAANMGGMITPYGNPQNLYLYSYYNIETIQFFKILLIQSITVAIILAICCLFIKNAPLVLKTDTKIILNKKRNINIFFFVHNCNIKYF